MNVTSGYTTNYYKQEEFKETINDLSTILFDFETTTSGEKETYAVSLLEL